MISRKDFSKFTNHLDSPCACRKHDGMTSSGSQDEMWPPSPLESGGYCPGKDPLKDSPRNAETSLNDT